MFVERETVAFRTEDPEDSSVYYTDSYTSLALVFPLTAKFSLNLNPFLLSGYGGVYYRAPIGGISMTSTNPKTGNYTFAYGNPAPYGIPFGVTVGVEWGFRLGPGLLAFDLRYGKDLSRTVVQGGVKLEYARDRIGLSVGYQIAILPKKTKVTAELINEEANNESDSE
jgi:hypothetical protein